MSNVCQQCSGFGRIIFRTLETIKCDMCNGSGEVLDKQILWKIQGEYLKNWRLDRLLTLREASRKFIIDASNLSKMERGVIKPSGEYAQKLKSN